MKFKDFEQIVKDKHPNAKVFMHGKFAGNKINVAVIFNGTHNEKVYQYNGTYCEVLNKLGIKAIYNHDYQALINALKTAKRDNGKKCKFFDIVMDKSREIEEYTKRLIDVEENYIIV